MEIKERKITELIEAEYNPRRLTQTQYKQLKDSLLRFGVVDPVLVNINEERKNIIIGGHQRTRVWSDLGNDTIPCVELSLTLEQEKELNVRLNKNTGEFDFDMLANFFEEDSLIDWGFEAEELDLSFGDDEEELEAQEDDYKEPEEVQTDIVEGDLITFEKDGKELHRLLCGDSTKKEDVERLMNGEKADMVFTDPPYGISIVSNSKVGGDAPFGSKKGKVGGDKIVEAKEYAQIIGDETTETAKKFYENCLNIGFDNFIIWGGNYFTDFLPPSMCWIVWDKQNTGNFADVELAWVSMNKAAKLYSWQWNGMIRQGNKSIEGKTRIHPTQKPVGLFNDIFKDFKFNSCFDGFGGSGSTMVACHQVNKKSYLIEMSKDYCQVITDRMKALDSDLIIKINGKEYEQQ